MGGPTYGITFSRKLREHGKYDEAIVAAEKDMARDADNPEPWFDRAAAFYCLGRFAEGANDLERAIALDADANLMDEGVLDDELFETLRKWAVAEPEQAAVILGRYTALLPKGAHRADVDKWLDHLGNAS